MFFDVMTFGEGSFWDLLPSSFGLFGAFKLNMLEMIPIC